VQCFVVGVWAKVIRNGVGRDVSAILDKGLGRGVLPLFPLAMPQLLITVNITVNITS